MQQSNSQLHGRTAETQGGPGAGEDRPAVSKGGDVSEGGRLYPCFNKWLCGVFRAQINLLKGTPSQTPVLARKDTLVFYHGGGSSGVVGAGLRKASVSEDGWQFKPQVMQTC